MPLAYCDARDGVGSSTGRALRRALSSSARRANGLRRALARGRGRHDPGEGRTNCCSGMHAGPEGAAHPGAQGLQAEDVGAAASVLSIAPQREGASRVCETAAGEAAGAEARRRLHRHLRPGASSSTASTVTAAPSSAVGLGDGRQRSVQLGWPTSSLAPVPGRVLDPPKNELRLPRAGDGCRRLFAADDAVEGHGLVRFRRLVLGGHFVTA